MWARTVVVLLAFPRSSLEGVSSLVVQLADRPARSSSWTRRRSSSSSDTSSSSSGEELPRRFPTIQELMKATEAELKLRQLESSRPVSMMKGAPFLELKDGPPSSTHEYLDWLEVLAGRRPQASDETYTVAVILGKGLARGRVSIEHAERVCGLVRALGEGLSPCLVVFASSAASRTQEEPTGLDDAHAACAYFQHCCESVLGASFPESRAIVWPIPLTTKESMRKLVASAIAPRLRTLDAPLHLALFASDYQLHRLDKVWKVTPRLSLLGPLAARNATKHKGPKKPEDRTFETSWSYCAVPYPPRLLAADPAGAFLARTYVVVDALVPLLVNLHAVCNKEEFLAREYYDDLLDVKQRLAHAQALVDSPMRPASLRSLPTMAALSPSELTALANRPDAPPLVDEALERVVRWLGELERTLRPAALRTDSLQSEDWRKALKLLQRTIAEARAATDPDLPLPASDWGKLLEASPVDKLAFDPSNAGGGGGDDDAVKFAADAVNGELDPASSIASNADFFFSEPPTRYWSQP